MCAPSHRILRTNISYIVLYSNIHFLCVKNDSALEPNSDAVDFGFLNQIRPMALSNDVDTDSACEDIDDDFNDEDVKPMIPQKVITMADEALSGLPPRLEFWSCCSILK